MPNLQKTTSTTKVIAKRWTVGSEVTDRSVLSDELAHFCAKYPIYHLKKLEDSMTASRIQQGKYFVSLLRANAFLTHS